MANSYRISISENTANSIDLIKEKYQFQNRAEVVELLMNHYNDSFHVLDEMNHTLTLHKKYLNELRKNGYINIAMLNAFAIALDIKYAPEHTNKDFRSQVLIDANENFIRYMKEIQIKLKGGENKAEEDLDATRD